MECIFSNVFRGGDFLRILTVLSDLMVPLLIFYVVGLGLLMKQDVFGDFLNGAKDGMRTVIGIVPTLIGLMAAGTISIAKTAIATGKPIGLIAEELGIMSQAELLNLLLPENLTRAGALAPRTSDAAAAAALA